MSPAWLHKARLGTHKMCCEVPDVEWERFWRFPDPATVIPAPTRSDELIGEHVCGALSKIGLIPNPDEAAGPGGGHYTRADKCTNLFPSIGPSQPRTHNRGQID